MFKINKGDLASLEQPGCQLYEIVKRGEVKIIDLGVAK
jgi:hypothetical protein